MTTVPDSDRPASAADSSTASRHAALVARYGALESELEAAPFHRVGTFWWDERTKEMRFINQRLGR